MHDRGTRHTPRGTSTPRSRSDSGASCRRELTGVPDTPRDVLGALQNHRLIPPRLRRLANGSRTSESLACGHPRPCTHDQRRYRARVLAFVTSRSLTLIGVRGKSPQNLVLTPHISSRLESRYDLQPSHNSTGSAVEMVIDTYCCDSKN